MIVLVLIGLGLYYRRQPQRHLRFMTAAFVTDLGLVVWIEATRGAVETVVSGPKTMVWAHAGISLAVLILYVSQIVLGRQLLARQEMVLGEAVTVPVHNGDRRRTLHLVLGLTFCVLRALNYVTALML
jgi:uncharacterized membrane protein YozB (DUF420 family)